MRPPDRDSEGPFSIVKDHPCGQTSFGPNAFQFLRIHFLLPLPKMSSYGNSPGNNRVSKVLFLGKFSPGLRIRDQSPARFVGLGGSNYQVSKPAPLGARYKRSSGTDSGESGQIASNHPKRAPGNADFGGLSQTRFWPLWWQGVTATGV